MQPGDTPDMSAILQQAQAMQEQLMTAQAELAETEVTGQAGNGLVTVTQTAAGEIRGLRIDPTIVDPSDIDTLQDLVLGALADAADNAAAMQAQKMGPLAGGFDMGGGAPDLGELGGGTGGSGLPRA